MASSHGHLAHLLPLNYKRFIADWLEEDCPSFDYGGFVVGESEGEANLLGKSKVSQGEGVCSWNDIIDKT
jgi:nicotinate-nucleotide pyrophosphorylase (carboxylating)